MSHEPEILISTDKFLKSVAELNMTNNTDQEDYYLFSVYVGESAVFSNQMDSHVKLKLPDKYCVLRLGLYITNQGFYSEIIVFVRVFFLIVTFKTKKNVNFIF